ncbi:UNVERIFIED_CONTAM: hypothetical protein Slati_4598000 [Sesamum latifolium]|uniref:Uncharacterized protein n=1 Tax=Sesamum latifolium TaxID=2727402 RepID=A0AAW2S1S7_9LAMI
MSIRGRGKGSFGHALFKSVKSIQRRHFPFGFGTNTTFANHSGYWTGHMYFGFKQLVYLVFYCLVPLHPEHPLLLLNRFSVGIYAEPMGNDIRRNPMKVRHAPSENFFVFL